MENLFRVHIVNCFKNIVTNWSNPIDVDEILLVFVKFVQITVHKLKNKGHFFWFIVEITLFLIVQDIKQGDNIWVS